MDPEAAPENLLTRGYSKRSLAAIEPEFVDSNTLDAHAPSSSVLQSDYLIIDENGNLGEHLDMSSEVSPVAGAGASAVGIPSPASSATSTTAVVGGESGGSGHAAKRVRYTFTDGDGSHGHPTAAELSVLQPVIQPDNSLRREQGGQQHGHHTHHHHSTHPHSVSRGRSVADLLPSTTDVAPLDMDKDASEAMGDPVDSSLGGLAMEVEPSEEERRHSQSHGPVEGRVTSAAAFLEPTKRLATGANPAHHHTATESLFTTAPPTSASAHPLNQTIPLPERKRSLSISSISTFGTPGAHSTHLADKKGLKREVKIQLLDEMESKPILEEARRASIDQLREAREDKRHPPSSSSSSSTAAILTAASARASNSPDQAEEEEEEEDTVLPKEDPTIHDWDQEELEDEEDLDSDSTPSPASLTSGNIPRQETISSLQKRQRKLDRDRSHRRASFLETGNSQPTSPSHTNSPSTNNSDVEEDKDDPFLDPERDSAFMSEAQEADTHNVHLRLENQRDFQDAAGLDLGEEESSNVNEDGQYGGMIEEEDEGEDFWENR
ncbi:hypothetical protein KI688_005525 [Linnemannia hyalina]|uniref:Uncharacterized protein n=1 Tax=Linnemannia hyalina TaxID=64524 RepID=A0A9P7Y135_9FUNG|nr:hypothetical protein KI688_005525 [Linnemannia hyalina]